MYEIVHDVQAVYEKINSTFASLGLPIRIEEYVSREKRCIGISTDEDNLNHIRRLLEEAGILFSVDEVHVGLEWMPTLYYVQVPQANVAAALAVLAQMQKKGRDVSAYMESISRANSRMGRVLGWAALIYAGFLFIMAIGLGQATFRKIAQEQWGLAFLFGALAMFLLVLLFLLIKHIPMMLRGSSVKPRNGSVGA